MRKALPLRPAKGMIVLLAVLLAASLALAILQAERAYWWVMAGAVVWACAMDGVLAWRGGARGLSASRKLAHAMALGVERAVELVVENTGKSPMRVQLHDHFPATFSVQGQPSTLTVPPESKASVAYRVTPLKRGPTQFGHIEMLLDSPLRLWQRRLWLSHEETVRVYPNFAAVAKFALIATDHRLSRLGVKLKRRRGEGMEFHQLREYREGDSLRQIDWKATTRQRKLISRDYQDERDQRLVFLLDCSRRMRAQDKQISHFDQALNSLMLLAHVALKQGDSVGAMSFGHAAAGGDRYFAPEKGGAALNLLTNALYDLEPQPRTADYLEAAQTLMKRVPKRSLVVILTNLRDEDEDELDLAIKVLARKHLVVLASLREEALGQVLETSVETLDDALQVSAAHHYLDARKRIFARLVRRETVALDVEPSKLPITLVNQYLEIKRSGRL
jgi:uncharacterized protein (DUF58 family)